MREQVREIEKERERDRERERERESVSEGTRDRKRECEGVSKTKCHPYLNSTPFMTAMASPRPIISLWLL